MPQSDYSATLLRSYENALDRKGSIIGQSEGMDGVPPIDLALFPSSDERPVAKMTTLGMSRKPLVQPKGQADDSEVRIELAMSFPSAWKLDGDEAGHWPIHELLKWATYPLLEDIFVWRGQTLTSEPMEQLSPDVDFCGWLAVDPYFVPDSATPLRVDEQEIYMIDLIPLYREELTFADEQGSDDLLERLTHTRTPPLVSPHRKNVCA